MAELGDISQILGEATDEKPIEVHADMLDYAYVEECKDVKVLRCILGKLKDKEYGHYPDLEKKTEEKLMSLLPPSEVMKMKRLKHQTTAQEIADAESIVSSWEETVRRKDAAISGATEAPTTSSSDIFAGETIKEMPRRRNLPPVRGSEPNTVSAANKTVRSSKSMSPGEAESKTGERLSGYDFKAWEKYDVDGALNSIDDEKSIFDNIKPGRTQEELKAEALAKRTAAHQREMENLQRELGSDSLTPLQRSTRGNREKVKGNECFRIGETQEAFDCYSRSLALDRTNPVTYANRAMAAIRLEMFELAEDDCSRSLDLDGTYIKAWSRRGMTRFKRGNYKGASEDFDQALTLDPNSAEMRKLWQSARDKYVEVEGKSLPTRDVADATSVMLMHVRNIGDFKIPPKNAVEVARGQCTITRPVAADDVAPQGFTRIQIADDSDSDNSDEEDTDERPEDAELLKLRPADASSKAGFMRVNIVEESDDDSSDEDETTPAVELSAEAIAQNAIKAEEFKAEGNAKMKAGSHREAIYSYTQSLNLNPKLVASLNNRAMAYLATNQYAEVIQDTSVVIELEPSNSKAWYRRGVAYFRLGENSKAMSDINNLLAREPKNAQALDIKKEITAALNSAPKKAPPTEVDMDNAKKLALAAMEDGDNAGAVRVLEASLKSAYFMASGNVTNLEVKVSLLHLLHTAYLRDGNPSEAQNALERILAVAPNNFKAILKCAEVLKQLDQNDKALDYVQMALKIDPQHTGALSLLNTLNGGKTNAAQSLKNQGNEAMTEQKYALAAGLYTEAISLDPTSIVSINNRAQAYLKMGEYKKAITDASDVIEKTRGVSSQTAIYRKALFRRGFSLREHSSPDLNAALADFKELLVLEPSNKTFQHELQRTEAMSSSMPPQPPAATEESGFGMTETKTIRKAHTVPTPDELPPMPKAVGVEVAVLDAPKKKVAGSKTLTKISPLKRPDVPSEPPKTVYEMEKVWRALKNYPDLFAQYLASFKKSTYKKVFKDSLSSDLISSVFASIKDHSDEAAIIHTLSGISGTSNFEMTLKLLPASDLDVLRQCFDKAASNDKCAEVRAKYNL
jgi:sperm-associated antigen 1